MPPPPRLAQISRKYDRNAHGTYRDGRGFGHYYDRDGNLVMVNPRLAQTNESACDIDPMSWDCSMEYLYGPDGLFSLAQTTESACDSNPMSYACYLFTMEYLYGPDASWLGLAQTTESPCDSNPMSWECAMEYMHGLAQIEAEESGNLSDCNDMCDE